MKVFVVLACLAVAASATIDNFQSFKTAHGKSYKNQVEERLRRQVYASNIQKIEAHNARYEAGLETYKMSENKFADLTAEEFAAFLKLSGKRPTTKANQIHKVKADAPESIDWRSQGAVVSVKDQGSCGSCWSFSAVGALEGQNVLKNNVLLSLSEQNLVDCSGSYGNAGCDGGWMDWAFEYVIDHGIQSEEDYPYTAKDGTCKFDSSKVVLQVQSYVDVKENDEADLKNAAGTVGPVAVAINANNNFQFYDSGVYSDSKCDPEGLNHGVLVVGYGNESGKDYWLVKNSWGTSWGETGYIKMERGVNLCGIASVASYPVL